MDKYITIAEFAKLAGVTKQAVYSRLNSQEFTSFLTEDGTGKRPKKLISTKALPLFNNGNCKQVKEPKKSSDTSSEKDFLIEQLHAKDELIDSLLQQFTSLVKQNRELTESIAVMNKELSTSISVMNENLTKLWSQQQTLEAMAQKKLETPKTEAAAPKSEPESEAAAAKGKEVQPVEPEPKEKKSFFSRLFSW